MKARFQHISPHQRCPQYCGIRVCFKNCFCVFVQRINDAVTHSRIVSSLLKTKENWLTDFFSVWQLTYHRAGLSYSCLSWWHISILLSALKPFLNISVMSFVFIKPSQITFSFPWCLTCFFYILWPWKHFPFSFCALHCIMIIEACELLEFNFST